MFHSPQHTTLFWPSLKQGQLLQLSTFPGHPLPFSLATLSFITDSRTQQLSTSLYLHYWCPVFLLSYWTSVHSYFSFCSSLTIQNTITLFLGHYPWTLHFPSLTFPDDAAPDSRNPLSWSLLLYILPHLHFIGFFHILSENCPNFIPVLIVNTVFSHALSFFSSCFFYASTRHLLLIALPHCTQLSLVLTQYLHAIHFSLTENSSIWQLPLPLVNLVL